MERKWRVLAVVCVAVFMLLLDITVVNVALPEIDKELNTSFTDLQWVVDAYALTLAATMLNAGSLGDLLGRKKVFLVAIALFTAASALCGAAQSPLWLILARGAQGIGGAGMFAVSLAIISQEFHGRERGTAFGIWGATVGLAVAIGPLVGGALTTYVGWRWIFFVNIPIGIVCVAAGLRELHESRNEEHGGADVPGLVTWTGALFALVLGLFRGSDWGWSSGRIVGLFIAAAVLLAAFAAIGVALLLMHGISLSSTWTTLLAGFVVGGIGIGLVNAPLASTSVSVVEPQRAGMASGINNTFRQVGIATGIAALGAIFQSQITSQVAASAIPQRFVQPFSKAISSGATQQALDAVPAPLRPRAETLAHSAFISGLNTILLVAAFVLFAGAILAFVLVRQQDFVASGPAVEAAAG